MVMQLARPAPRAEIIRQSAEQTAQSFNVRFYHEAYARGLNVSEFLERMDPTRERPEAERSLDAFERVLKASGIRVNSVPEAGIWPSTWEECTGTPERRALMPELMSRIWRQATRLPQVEKRAILLSGDTQVGGLANPWWDNPEIRAKRLVPPIPLDAIIARTTPIDSDAYRTIYVIDDWGTDAYRMKRVAEGAEIPTTTLVTAEHSIRLYKFGRALRATYEQLRRQRVDRIAFVVARMALQAEADKVSMVENTIINGDGNQNTSAIVMQMTIGETVNGITYGALDAGATAGTLMMRAWQTFKLRFSLSYAPNVVIAQENGLMQLLLLPIGQGPGLMPLALMPNNPFGVVGPLNDYLAGGVRYGLDPGAPSNKLIAFQSDLAVERVTEVGGNVSEVERFVTNQTQILTLTEVEGYGVIDPNAARILDYGH